MMMRQIKSGSLTLSFTIDGTVYMLKMLKEEGIGEPAEPKEELAEEEQDSGPDNAAIEEFETFVVELHAAHKVVYLSKTVEDGKSPEYKMEGPGMEDEEMKQFVHNWKAIVAQEVVGFSQNEDSLNSTVESFLHLFDHYFGNRIREMISSTDDAQDPMVASVSDTPPELNTAGQDDSNRGQKRKSESDTNSSKKESNQE